MYRFDPFGNPAFIAEQNRLAVGDLVGLIKALALRALSANAKETLAILEDCRARLNRVSAAKTETKEDQGHR